MIHIKATLGNQPAAILTFITYFAIGMLWGLPAPAHSAGFWGTWAKEGVTPPGWDFVLGKWGSTDRHGNFKARTHLRTNEAWVTYRLPQDLILNPAAGKKLGERLSVAEVKAIELDIERVDDPVAFVPYFQSVRAHLKKSIELRIAVPTLSDTPLPGPTWKKAEAAAVSLVTDGIDIMLYDTGITEAAAYHALFRDILLWSVEHQRTTGKKVTIGLPAYEDRTVLHHSRVENLQNIHSALQQLAPAEIVRFCAHPPRFAIYAEWTLDEGERGTINSLQNWKIQRCGG